MNNFFSENLKLIKQIRKQGASDIEIIERLHSLDITIVQSIAIYADTMNLKFSEAKQHLLNSNFWKDSFKQMNENTREFLEEE